MDRPLPEAFAARLLHHFGLPPTQGQERLFYAFTRFVYSWKERCALLIKGYAGTGKTSSVSAMVRTLEELGVRVVLLAPTGRAAKVLSAYSGRPAFTIHKHIYQRRSDRRGGMWFDVRENELEDAVFFVDEASMIGSGRSGDDSGSGDLLEDLMAFVYAGSGCRLVLIGDDAQLPPVGSDYSPALDLSLIRDRYGLNCAEIGLTEVIRQAQGSGILMNATALRDLITNGSRELPHVRTAEYTDVHRVTGDIQEYLEDAVRRHGWEGTILLTRSNKRANLFNQQVRIRLLDHEEEISSNDRMMVLRNNYFWLEEKVAAEIGFIANGDIILVRRVRGFEDRGEFRFCRAVIQLAEYPELPEMEVLLLCTPIWEDAANLSQEKMQRLWEEIARDYPDITDLRKLRKAVQEDRYYNALQVKFAYAITVHKAQGGQWPCVFVDQGYLTDEMTGPELNRWFYTAFTRAQEELYLVGFEDRLID